MYYTDFYQHNYYVWIGNIPGVVYPRCGRIEFKWSERFFVMVHGIKCKIIWGFENPVKWLHEMKGVEHIISYIYFSMEYRVQSGKKKQFTITKESSAYKLRWRENTKYRNEPSTLNSEPKIYTPRKKSSPRSIITTNNSKLHQMARK